MTGTDANRLETIKRLLDQGQQDIAVPRLVKLLQHEPENPDGWYLLGVALTEPEKKIFAFNQTIKLAPQHPGARVQLHMLAGGSSSEQLDTETNQLDRAPGPSTGRSPNVYLERLPG